MVWLDELPSIFLIAFLSPETTLTLRNLATELQEVVDWYRVGLSLGIKSYQLEEIRINRMGDAMHCKLSMLDSWLRGDVEASWNKLAGALEESNHSFIADRIREKYLGIKIRAGKLYVQWLFSKRYSAYFRHSCSSLIPRPLPSFPSLAVHCTGNETTPAQRQL